MSPFHVYVHKDLITFYKKLTTFIIPLWINNSLCGEEYYFPPLDTLSKYCTDSFTSMTRNMWICVFVGKFLSLHWIVNTFKPSTCGHTEKLQTKPHFTHDCTQFGTTLEQAQQTFSFSTRLVLCSLWFSRTVRASWCLRTSGCTHIKHQRQTSTGLSTEASGSEEIHEKATAENTAGYIYLE